MFYGVFEFDVCFNMGFKDIVIFGLLIGILLIFKYFVYFIEGK